MLEELIDMGVRKYDSPLVSVVVPIYNMEKYLPECIESLIDQTYKNLEVILVDDGSTDKCPEISDKYASRDSRIKVIHKSNRGSASARKYGTEAAKGKYVTYVDSDDWIDKDMLNVLVSHALNHSADVVICTIVKEAEDGSRHVGLYFKEGFYDEKRIKSEIIDKMVSTGRYGEFGIPPRLCGTLFCCNLVKKYVRQGPVDVSLGDDATITYPMYLAAKRLVLIDKPLYHYRQNEDSMTHAFNRMQTLDTINLINYLRNVVKIYQNPSLDLQIDLYHCMITIRNVVNIGFAGFKDGFGKRISDFKYYIKETDFDIVVKRVHLNHIDAKAQVKYGLFMIKHNMSGLLLIVYSIKSTIKDIILRHNIQGKCCG